MARHIQDGHDVIKVFKDRKKYKPTLRHLNDALTHSEKQLAYWTKWYDEHKPHPGGIWNDLWMVKLYEKDVAKLKAQIAKLKQGGQL